MKVLFAPFAENNPYQQQLAAALSKHGVEVQMVSEFRRLPLLSSIYKDGRPDILHLHWTSPFWHHQRRYLTYIAIVRFLIELIAIKLLGVRLVWTVHNLHAHDSPNPRLEHLVNRFSFQLYDHVIIHCRSAKLAITDAYRLPDHAQDKISVIGHGDFVNYYADDVSQSEARDLLGLPDSGLVCLFFGRISPYKGIFQLVEAFGKRICPRDHLIIAGRPSSSEILRALQTRCRQEPRVQLHLRHIPDNEIQIYMRAADLVVLPFREILTSGTVMLAMSFGKAVLTPQLGCVAEILDEQGALFYDHEDPDGLEKALQRALSVDLAAKGQHNLSLAKTYRWDEIGRKTSEVYTRCLST